MSGVNMVPQRAFLLSLCQLALAAGLSDQQHGHPYPVPAICTRSGFCAEYCEGSETTLAWDSATCLDACNSDDGYKAIMEVVDQQMCNDLDSFIGKIDKAKIICKNGLCRIPSKRGSCFVDNQKCPKALASSPGLGGLMEAYCQSCGSGPTPTTAPATTTDAPTTTTTMAPTTTPTTTMTTAQETTIQETTTVKETTPEPDTTNGAETTTEDESTTPSMDTTTGPPGDGTICEDDGFCGAICDLGFGGAECSANCDRDARKITRQFCRCGVCSEHLLLENEDVGLLHFRADSSRRGRSCECRKPKFYCKKLCDDGLKCKGHEELSCMVGCLEKFSEVQGILEEYQETCGCEDDDKKKDDKKKDDGKRRKKDDDHGIKKRDDDKRRKKDDDHRGKKKDDDKRRKKDDDDDSGSRSRRRKDDGSSRRRRKDDDDDSGSRRRKDDDSGSRRRKDDDSGSRRRKDDDSGSRRRKDDEGGSRRRKDDDSGSRRRKDDEGGSRKRKDDDSGSRRRKDDESGSRRRKDDASSGRRRKDHGHGHH